MKAPISALGIAVLFTAGCAGQPETPAEQAPVSEEAPAETRTIVATTTILGSVAQQIAQCAGNTEVEVLMPLGVDPHDYQPSSAQLAAVADAGFVVANGLFLEESLVEPLEDLEAGGGTVFRMATLINPLPFGAHDSAEDNSAEKSDDSHDHGNDHGDDHGDEQAEDHDHDHGSDDPHFWMDMNRVATGTEALGEELGAQYGPEFSVCGEQVADAIRSAEQEMIDILDAIPEERRILVTDHDALGYFADRYGFDVAGVVIPGGSTLAEASSQDLAELVERIEALGLKAMFGNFHAPSDLLEAVAEESGGIDVVPLYIGSIGQPGSEQESYQEMMLYDARQIAQALGN